MKNIEIIYFDNFEVEHVPVETEKFIGHKNQKIHIIRTQANKSIMFGYFGNGFINFMFEGKTLIDYTTLYSPYDFDKDVNTILSYCKNE